MKAGARTLRTLCGAVAVLALTVGCDPEAAGTAGATGPAGSGQTAGGSAVPADREAADKGTPDAAPDRGAADAKPGGGPAKPSPATSSPAPAPDPGGPAPLLQEGSEGRDVREVQARLQQLGLFGRNPSGYYGTMTSASVRALQKKERLVESGTTTADTWRVLRARSKQPTAEQLNPQTSYPLADPDKRCRTGRVLCISKESRTLAWMVDGTVKAAMDVRFGSEYTPTREGTFKVDFKSRDHHSTLYDTPMPYAMFFSGGQAVHYSADFAAAGYNGASHGCVNVREKEKIAKVFDEVKAGDKVIVYS